MYCIKNRGWMAEWQSARHARYSADLEQQQAVRNGSILPVNLSNATVMP
jgi:hypothetical protein